jgi:polyisoprenoid-binding protein YceI
MRSFSSALVLASLLAVAAPSTRADETRQPAPTPPAATELPAGEYALDKAHASLTFRVNHLGFSHYTTHFERFDARLQIDPANPAHSSVTATIDPHSIETPYSNLNQVLQKAEWLDSAQFPEIVFHSTQVELTGPNSAHITGELSLRGLTRPVVMDATFNGGWAHNPMDPMGSRIGFSAHGALKRSDFGVSFGIPPAGSTMGVSDDVEFAIEAEFTKPVPATATTAH